MFLLFLFLHGSHLACWLLYPLPFSFKKRWFWRYFLLHPDDIILDVKGEIFHTLHGVKPEALIPDTGTEGVFWSNLTKTAPCILHGNGMGKPTLRKVVDQLELDGWISYTNRTKVYKSDVRYGIAD